MHFPIWNLDTAFAALTRKWVCGTTFAVFECLMRSTKPSPPADDVLAAMAESHDLGLLSLKPDSSL